MFGGGKTQPRAKPRQPCGGGVRSVGGRAFGGRLGEVALARAEEQAAHGGAVPGDQRVEIAAAVTDTLGGGGENAEEDAAEGEATVAVWWVCGQSGGVRSVGASAKSRLRVRKSRRRMAVPFREISG